MRESLEKVKNFLEKEGDMNLDEAHKIYQEMITQEESDAATDSTTESTTVDKKDDINEDKGNDNSTDE